MGGFRSRSRSGGNGDAAGAGANGAHGRNAAHGADRAGTGSGAAGRSGGRRPAPASGRRGSGRDDRDNRDRGRAPRGRRTGDDRARDVPAADPVREVALDVLRQVSAEDAYANLVLPGALRRRGLDGRDAAFATELTYGTLRALGLLDAVIAEAAGRPVSGIDAPVLDVLRLGAYQILRTRVSGYAAVDTSVTLARSLGLDRATGFVNGVLRTLTRRDPEEWVATVAGGSDLAALALRTSHPVWIAEVFARALGLAPESAAGSDELRRALEADDTRPVVHLAARPGQITAEELALVTGGEVGRWSPYAVYLDEGDPGDLDALREGLAGVQDEGSQLIALATVRAPLDREDTGRWLDLCAGPGGKSAFLGAWAQTEGAVLDAVEVVPHRAELVEKATRGLPVTVHVGDGRHPGRIPGLAAAVDAGGHDRVLVDAPCTGLGALRRRPEARWRKSPSDVPDLVRLQRDLLRAGLRATAPGGVTVYSTCSPHPGETVDVVREVAEREGATVLDARRILPEVTDLDDAPWVQLWPHRHGTDAMFIAVLRPGSGGCDVADAR
ncbi:RsmB/NOP family class I SAM-dependent RNA methyltransferase [Corynebacterium bovis]|uniref:RsmB/NOP family class I SAM-dependent RNA methyltransferase n=1 Tax=Corynebacterium bovis TaxID=36808 RepID=UPI000F6503D4|nr:transcription antitermination factor NusB [Corynebacterium bovis]RRO91218.1 methyltransferase [Corynebacterium bovis]RRQ15737.1 methyltransferase [Corynebacterium bovis]